jgi:hypothetical protein
VANNRSGNSLEGSNMKSIEPHSCSFREVFAGKSYRRTKSERYELRIGEDGSAVVLAFDSGPRARTGLYDIPEKRSSANCQPEGQESRSVRTQIWFCQGQHNVVLVGFWYLGWFSSGENHQDFETRKWVCGVWSIGHICNRFKTL